MVTATTTTVMVRLQVEHQKNTIGNSYKNVSAAWLIAMASLGSATKRSHFLSMCDQNVSRQGGFNHFNGETNI